MIFITHYFTNPNKDSFIPFILGIMVFMVLVGPNILNGSNTDWLMAYDPAQYWLGWQFFRDTPFWQWPLGKNWPYGMEISSSIVYSDSNTLMALLFKPFSDWLPERFQYLGIWIFICFILQSVFAWKLLSRFIDNRWMVLIGTLYFLIAPPWLYRITEHPSTLASHWFLLAALWLYFSHAYRWKGWLLLIALASLINYHFLIWCSAILIADAMQKILLKKIKWVEAIKFSTITFSLAIYLIWITGAFMISDRLNYPYSYGLFRFNLWSPFNPSMDWSVLIPPIKQKKFELEGFNYLGLGIILLLVIAMIVLTYHRLSNINPSGFIKNNTPHYRLTPIVTLSILFTLFAATHTIAIGKVELIAFSLPPMLQATGDSFRGSGRFFWLAFYLIYLGTILAIWRRFTHKTAIVLCTFTLILQLADSYKALYSFKQSFSTPPSWHSPMKSTKWDAMVEHYSHIKIVPIFPSPITTKHWVSYLELAVRNHRPINSAYLSRFDRKSYTKEAEKLLIDVSQGHFDDRALYIFDNEDVWMFAKKFAREDDALGEMDGFYYLAPRYHSNSR